MTDAHVLVLGGASWNRMVHLPELPDGRPGTVPHARSYQDAGSTGIGKALALKALGHDPVLHIVLGRDDAGARVRGFCSARGLRLIVDETRWPTARHLNLMAPDGARLSVFLEAGDPEPAIDTGRLAPLIAAADAIFLGITPSSLPLISLVAKSAADCLVDLHDYDGGTPWHDPFIASADVIQLAHEAVDDAEALTARLLAGRARQVVLTRGAAGALIRTSDRSVVVPPVPARLRDSNGAGDMFSVALWHGQGRGWPVGRAARFAAAAAAICVEADALVPAGLNEAMILARMQR